MKLIIFNLLCFCCFAALNLLHAQKDIDLLFLDSIRSRSIKQPRLYSTLDSLQYHVRYTSLPSGAKVVVRDMGLILYGPYDVYQFDKYARKLYDSLGSPGYKNSPLAGVISIKFYTNDHRLGEASWTVINTMTADTLKSMFWDYNYPGEIKYWHVPTFLWYPPNSTIYETPVEHIHIIRDRPTPWKQNGQGSSGYKRILVANSIFCDTIWETDLFGSQDILSLNEYGNLFNTTHVQVVLGGWASLERLSMPWASTIIIGAKEDKVDATFLEYSHRVQLVYLFNDWYKRPLLYFRHMEHFGTTYNNTIDLLRPYGKAQREEGISPVHESLQSYRVFSDVAISPRKKAKLEQKLRKRFPNLKAIYWSTAKNTFDRLCDGVPR